MPTFSALLIKAGFVDTRMTFGRPGIFLVALPRNVGRRIAEATLKGVGETYVLGFWRLIMILAHDPGGDFQEDEAVALVVDPSQRQELEQRDHRGRRWASAKGEENL